MSHHNPGPTQFKNLRSSRREAISLTQEELVKTEPLYPGTRFPMMMTPTAGALNLVQWADSNSASLGRQVLEHGAILLRGFEVKSPVEFEQFIATVSGNALEYRERTSPRSQVNGNIYTSTDHPADQSIFLHNEHSYAHAFPLKIFFFCVTPAERGGATPIGDTRKLTELIDPKIKQRFKEKGYMYVRNFGDGFGLSWQTAFQTSDKARVEQYCREHKIEYEWKAGDRLRTRQIRPAFAQHPRTGEELWFNHIVFFHISTLPAHIGDALRATFEEQDLPNNTYYGDGSPIEAAILEELTHAYEQATVAFPWQTGDVLMLDNMLASHGREPFEGSRKIVVGMSEPFTRSDI